MSVVFAYDVIIAHGPGCNDGATSAWCFWRLLSQPYRELLAKEGGFYSKPKKAASDKDYIHPNSPEGALKLQERGFPVVFVFIQPGDSINPLLIQNKRVVIVDVDMGDALLPIVQSATSVVLIDHHESSLLTITKYREALFDKPGKFVMFVNTDKSQCGATLTWKLTHFSPTPSFVQIVRIGDVWQWDEYPHLHAKYVLKALRFHRVFRSFPDIEDAFTNWDSNFESYVQRGREIVDYEEPLIKQIAKHCDLGFIQTTDGNVYTVAYVQANILHSEVGVAVKWYAEQRFKILIHFCATWKYVSHRGLVSVSLRNPESGINLATIARNVRGTNNRGGGHAEAAGFSFYGIENLHKFIMKYNPSAKAYTKLIPEEISKRDLVEEISEKDFVNQKFAEYAKFIMNKQKVHDIRSSQILITDSDSDEK